MEPAACGWAEDGRRPPDATAPLLPGPRPLQAMNRQLPGTLTSPPGGESAARRPRAAARRQCWAGGTRRAPRWLTGAQLQTGRANGEGAGPPASRPAPAPPPPPTSACGPRGVTTSGVTPGRSPLTPLRAARSGGRRGARRIPSARRQPMGGRRGAGRREAMLMVRARSAIRDPAARRRAGPGLTRSPSSGLRRPFCQRRGRGPGPADHSPPPGGQGRGKWPCTSDRPGRERPGASRGVAREGNPEGSKAE